MQLPTFLQVSLNDIYRCLLYPQSKCVVLIWLGRDKFLLRVFVPLEYVARQTKMLHSSYNNWLQGIQPSLAGSPSMQTSFHKSCFKIHADTPLSYHHNYIDLILTILFFDKSTLTNLKNSGVDGVFHEWHSCWLLWGINNIMQVVLACVNWSTVQRCSCAD